MIKQSGGEATHADAESQAEEDSIAAAEYHGGLDGSDRRLAALERQQDQEQDEPDEGLGDSNYYEVDELPSLPDFDHSGYENSNDAQHAQYEAEEEALSRQELLAETRWEQVIELFDPRKHDYYRFGDLADKTGYRTRDDWKVEDFVEALDEGSANRTLRDSLGDFYRSASVRVQAFLRNW